MMIKKYNPSYFISYEYYDIMDINKNIKTDSFVTTDGLLYISPSDLKILSEDIQKNLHRVVIKYINVNRLDREEDSL